MSATRRIERIKRLEELQALEQALHSHHVKESQSFIYYAKQHWRKHGPIIAAFVCGLASMTASFALWQTGYLQQKEKTELKAHIDTARTQKLDVQRRNEQDARESSQLLQSYIISKTAVVTAPASVTPVSSGWFGSSIAMLVPESANSATPMVNTTYTASKADIAKLAQLQNDIKQTFA